MKTDEFLDEYLSETISSFSKRNEEYRQRKEKKTAILNRNPKLARMLDRLEPCELTAADCEDLIAYLKTDNGLVCNELRACYQKGFLDAVKTQKQFDDNE